MRQGEACRLERSEVGLEAGTLVIAGSKFGKSRQVFLHPTAAAALRGYERDRDRAFPGPRAVTFFVNSRDGPLEGHNIQHTFAVLTAAAGIQAPPGRRAPRLHDLRHMFTVATMLDWYRDGGDVQARLPLLSTWLGHVDPKSTYCYLGQRSSRTLTGARCPARWAGSRRTTMDVYSLRDCSHSANNDPLIVAVYEDIWLGGGVSKK